MNNDGLKTKSVQADKPLSGRNCGVDKTNIGYNSYDVNIFLKKFMPLCGTQYYYHQITAEARRFHTFHVQYRTHR